MHKRISTGPRGDSIFPVFSTPALSIAKLPSKFMVLLLFIHTFFFIWFSNQPVLEYFFLLLTATVTYLPLKFFKYKSSIFLFIRVFIIVVFSAIVTVGHIQYFLIQPFRVNQKSMLPEISPGELILVEKFSMGFIVNYYTNEKTVTRFNFPGSRPIQISDIVIFRKPDSEDILIKRVVRIENDNYCVYGDNRESSVDSRVFGCISENKIIGRYLYKING